MTAAHSAGTPAYASRQARDAFLTLGEDALCARCEVDRYRASGPGGQHRNKTESAVRLRLIQWGLVAIAADSRSQHDNKRYAAQRMRAQIACAVRVPIELGSGCSADSSAPLDILVGHSEVARREGVRSPQAERHAVPGVATERAIAMATGGTAPLGAKTRLSSAYWLAMADVLDVFWHLRGEVAATGASLGISTGVTAKLLLHDDIVARAVAEIRKAFGLRALR